MANIVKDCSNLSIPFHFNSFRYEYVWITTLKSANKKPNRIQFINRLLLFTSYDGAAHWVTFFQIGICATMCDVIYDLMEIFPPSHSLIAFVAIMGEHSIIWSTCNFTLKNVEFEMNENFERHKKNRELMENEVLSFDSNMFIHFHSLEIRMFVSLSKPSSQCGCWYFRWNSKWWRKNVTKFQREKITLNFSLHIWKSRFFDFSLLLHSKANFNALMSSISIFEYVIWDNSTHKCHTPTAIIFKVHFERKEIEKHTLTQMFTNGSEKQMPIDFNVFVFTFNAKLLDTRPKPEKNPVDKRQR